MYKSNRPIFFRKDELLFLGVLFKRSNLLLRGVEREVVVKSTRFAMEKMVNCSKDKNTKKELRMKGFCDCRDAIPRV